jgi:hypothetical protein
MMTVNENNLSECVTEALQLVSDALLQRKAFPDNSFEKRDLYIAREALELIQSELESGRGRLIGQRSASFTRYVIDEGPNMKMDSRLKNLIVQIETVYKKYRPANRGAN